MRLRRLTFSLPSGESWSETVSDQIPRALYYKHGSPQECNYCLGLIVLDMTDDWGSMVVVVMVVVMMVRGLEQRKRERGWSRNV